MGRVTHGATSRYNAQPLPYTIYDRMRDRILKRAVEGYLTQAQYHTDIARIDRREKRENDRRKAERRGRA